MAKQPYYKRFIAIIAIGLICGGIMSILLETDYLRWIEHKSLDFRFLCRGTIPTSDKILIIGTDEEALDKIKEPFIFWNPYFAEVIKAIAGGGARVIGFDFLQTIPLKKKIDGEDHDGIMANALMEAENVIMINLLRWDDKAKGLKVDNPLPRYQYASDPENIGFSNLTIDNDGCIRRQTLLLSDEENNVYAYFGLKVVAKYFNSIIEKKGDTLFVGDCEVPVNTYNEMLVNFAGPSGTFPVISFYKVWQLAHQGNTEFFKKNFKDKIILIGPGNIYSQDFKPTPYYRSSYYSGIRQTPGVEIVANVINTILEKRFITTLQPWQTVCIIIFLGMLISFTSFSLSPVYGGIAAFSIAASYIYLSIFLFNHYSIWLHLVCPADVVPLTYTIVFAYRYSIEDKEKRRIWKIFKHYVSEEVVEELLQYPGTIPLGGNRVQVTVLFADIRDFTSFSENRDPWQVVAVLNSFFARMVDIILKNKGTLDKYIGDGLLAFFGAPITRSGHADMAVISAIEMVSQLETLNRELNLDKPLSIGIGIHSGEAIVGNIGSAQKMEYTIIGDTVNIASRIERITRESNANILITGETFELLNNRGNISLDKEVVLRGRTKPIMIYRVKE
ncbi:MAG: adenylate/guanylate cyclase domain-containing protein [Candidatus Brocadiaceae bacterium]